MTAHAMVLSRTRTLLYLVRTVLQVMLNYGPVTVRIKNEEKEQNLHFLVTRTYPGHVGSTD